MNFITKEELSNKDLTSKFSIMNGNLILGEEAEYKSIFEVGDIVAYRNDTKKIGVVSFIEDDELNINWMDNTESTEASCDLIVVPPTLGLELLKDNNILNLWESLSNGKNDNFDLKCIYINDIVINEVPFIRAYKNTDTLVDKRFRRNFTLYRKFGTTQIFRTNLYTICDNKIGLDTSRFVYYLLEDHIVYYLGLDLNKETLATYLYKK
ncbi:MAG: hypothetical protein RR712_05300 [Terrisporobacter sp.]|uniref:hypothetical protein n=1 Tax=Terrisporobacter sp. TaxID=1965305 RepID=UPI002FCBB646